MLVVNVIKLLFIVTGGGTKQARMCIQGILKGEVSLYSRPV
jgi:hypothetical protein